MSDTSVVTTTNSDTIPGSWLQQNWGIPTATVGLSGAYSLNTMYPGNEYTEGLALALSIGALVGAADFLGNAAEDLGEKSGASGTRIGFALGGASSIPELVVSVQAALANNFDIGLGNIEGSNIANPLLGFGVPMALFGMKTADGTIGRMNFDNKWMVGSGLTLPILSAANDFGIASMDTNSGLAMLGALGVYGYGKMNGWDQEKYEKQHLKDETQPALSDALITELDNKLDDIVPQDLLNLVAWIQTNLKLTDDQILECFGHFAKDFKNIKKQASNDGKPLTEKERTELEKKLGGPIAKDFGPVFNATGSKEIFLSMADYLAKKAEETLKKDPVTNEGFDQLEKKLDIKIPQEQRETFWRKYGPTLAKMGIGLTALITAADLIVANGQATATNMGVHPSLAGTIAVAIGTSLPEIAINMKVFLDKQYDMAFGNILGSMTFNSLMIGGIMALFMNGEIPDAFQLVNDGVGLNWQGIMNNGFLTAATLYMYKLTKDPEFREEHARTIGLAGIGSYAAFIGSSYVIGS